MLQVQVTKDDWPLLGCMYFIKCLMPKKAECGSTVQDLAELLIVKNPINQNYFVECFVHFYILSYSSSSITMISSCLLK